MKIIIINKKFMSLFISLAPLIYIALLPILSTLSNNFEFYIFLESKFFIYPFNRCRPENISNIIDRLFISKNLAILIMAISLVFFLLGGKILFIPSKIYYILVGIVYLLSYFMIGWYGSEKIVCSEQMFLDAHIIYTNKRQFAAIEAPLFFIIHFFVSILRREAYN